MDVVGGEVNGVAVSEVVGGTGVGWAMRVLCLGRSE